MRGELEEEEQKALTIVWQITQAKPFLIGALSDENCEGLTP